MKKVRKSLIVLPAIATLALTTVASVAGTAAWFLSTTTAKVTAGQFQAQVLNGSLHVTATANPYAGTKSATAGDTTNTSATVTVDGHMGDASWDYSKLYTALTSDKDITGYVDRGGVPTNGTKPNDVTSSAWYKGSSDGTTHVWHAVSWDLTFTSDAITESSSNSVVVLFDPDQSNIADAADINLGLDIALMAGGEHIVYGADSHDGHITEADKTAPKSDGSGSGKFGAEYVAVNDNTGRIADGAADTFTASKYYLGTLDKDHTELKVKCVAWYEGTDTNVITDAAKGDAVAADLVFYSRNIIA